VWVAQRARGVLRDGDAMHISVGRRLIRAEWREVSTARELFFVAGNLM
jgi:hypothetical protein